MSDTSYNFPTEEVELPSKGLVYPKDNPLSEGKIVMKYMTTREEDILTNQNYIKQGIVLDKLLDSMVVSKIKQEDLLIGDKNAILIAARILGYGKNYNFSTPNPDPSEPPIPIVVDLTKLKETILEPSSVIQPNVNEFSLALSTGATITFKLLTVGDDKKIANEVKSLKKLKGESSEISTRLRHMITSVNGDTQASTINEFVSKMLATESRELRKYIKQIQPNVELNFEYDFGKGIEEVPIPITTDFFWPTD